MGSPLNAPEPNPFRRLGSAIALVASVIVCGGSVIFTLGGGRWTLSESMYMALISVSTVGFGELPSLEFVPGARPVVAATILLGLGSVAYFQSVLTALLVGGVVQRTWRKNRMKNQIRDLRDHVVVCGVGSTGRHIVEELAATKRPFVAIDRNHDHLLRVSAEVMGGNMLFIHGNATEDHTLLEAGIDRAHGVIAALTDDRDNLFVTLSARTLNAKARIVAKVVENEAERKMLRAGANSTVSPNTIGGRRMASEMLRPVVVEFLDQMLHNRDRNLRLEEVNIPEDSSFCGQTLRTVPIRPQTNALVVAVRDTNRLFIYNPGPDFVLTPGVSLVVLGEVSEVKKLRILVEQSSASGAKSGPAML